MNYKEYISPHFKHSEFRCKCCGKLPATGISPLLVLKLELLRKAIGNKPIIIRSGYRCPSHNTRVGGARKSQHLYGRAADIVVRGMTPSQLFKIAEPILYNGGLSLYKEFIHIDSRGVRARW